MGDLNSDSEVYFKLAAVVTRLLERLFAKL